MIMRSVGASKYRIDLIACTVIVQNKLILYEKSFVSSIFFSIGGTRLSFRPKKVDAERKQVSTDDGMCRRLFCLGCSPHMPCGERAVV
jgi:hypothetical protein